MILSIQNLSFSYGEKPALSDISLDVESGSVLCIMGPNGSGKSTLIDTVLGLHIPSKGRIFLDGQNLQTLTRQQIAQRAAYVPQNHSVTFPYTVREAVLMGRAAYLPSFGSPSAEDMARCEDAMEQAGVQALADRPYGSISGGELRLVLLARALCQDSPLILMDEPTAHLDYRNELIFLETVSSLCRDHGIAIIIATHSPQQAFYLDSHGLNVSAVFLKKGHIVTIGSPDSCITTDLLKDVYGVDAKILESEGEKTILLRSALKGDRI